MQPPKIELSELTAILMAGALAYFTWISGFTGVAVAFPFVWLFAGTRRAAFFAAVTYYLVGSRVIPDSAAAFFGDAASALQGYVLWFASSLTLGAVWGGLWTAKAYCRSRFPWRLFGALLLVSLPPIGLIGWLNPLLSASSLFPGWGFGGLSLVLFLWISPWALHRLPAWTTGVVGGVIIASVVAAHLTEKNIPTLATWYAVDTNLGKYPSQVGKQVERQIGLLKQAKEGFGQGAKLILFPEQVGGYQDMAIVELWRRELPRLPWSGKQVLMVGVEQPIDGEGNVANALMVATEGKILGYVTARQTVPVAMWRPWAQGEHYPIDWFKTNIAPAPVEGKMKPVAVVFCFEEFLVWPILTTMALEEPVAILSVVNGWWASKDEHILQRQHIEAWARLFGIPLLRAVNS